MRDQVDPDAMACSHLYGMLSTVFRRPLRVDTLARLRAPEMLAAFAAAGVDPGEDFARQDEPALLHVLAIDYTQLFHGPEDRISLHESLHMKKGSDLMGGAAHAVRRFMADVGFMVAPESGELPDHLGVELAFMAELARREAAALETGDAASAALTASLQRRFLAAHLGRWAGPLARAVVDRATTPFYKAMGDLLERFIDEELARDGTVRRACDTDGTRMVYSPRADGNNEAVDHDSDRGLFAPAFICIRGDS